jgi:hypothetical protein
MVDYALTPEEQFIKYHDRLRDELNRAYTHHEICKTLRKLTSSNYLNELNVAPSFFSLTVDAHLFATIMGINRFIDEHARAFKMKTFFEFIERNFNIFSDEAYIKHLRNKGYDDQDCEYWLKKRTRITHDIVNRDKEIIENLPAENLKDWRDKKLAHIDEIYVLKDAKVSQESPITSADIDQIINTLHEVLNRYLLAYDGSEWVIGAPAAGISDQIVFILDSIRFYQKTKRK